jgi:hypothetical protein
VGGSFTILHTRIIMHKEVHGTAYPKPWTNISMQLIPSCPTTEEIPSIICNPKVHYRVYKSHPLAPILRQINPFHTSPTYLRSTLILFLHLCLCLPVSFLRISLFKLCIHWKMPSSGMWRRVDLLQTDVSEERVASIFRVEEITPVRKSVRRLLTDWLQFGGADSTHYSLVTAVKTSNPTSVNRAAYPVRLKLKTKLHGLSPRANYTDRAIAACRRSNCHFVRIEDATWSAWRIPPAVLSRFSRQEPLLFYQVAPQLCSRGWVHPVRDPLLFFSGSAGNRTRASGFVAKNSDH